MNPSNVRCMKRHGVVVWMTAEIRTIMDRMSKDESSGEFRPSLTGGRIRKEVEETLAERIPLYEGAMDFQVSTDGVGVEEICSRVEDELRRLKINGIDP